MINHYTTIDTLELILKNSTIRFTRLDCLDDLSEVKNEIAPGFGANWFASCWTQEEVESLPLWDCYGARRAGVRITLNDFPFVAHRITGRRGKGNVGVNIPTEIVAPFSFDEVFRDGFIVIPEASDISMGGAVKYVDNPRQYYADYVTSGEDWMTISTPGELARLKDKMWEFQNEYRFLLNVHPGPPRNDDTTDYDADLVKFYSEKKGKGVPCVSFVDIRLAPSSLSAMTITVGPDASTLDFEKINRIVNDYYPTVTVVRSKFNGLVRPRKCE